MTNLSKLKVFNQLKRPIIGNKLEDIANLSYGGFNRVVIESDEELILPPEFYVIRSGGVQHINAVSSKLANRQLVQNNVFRRPESYVQYIRYEMESLIEYPNEEVEIDSFGKVASERSAVNQVAESMFIKVSCSFDRARNIFIITASQNKRTRDTFSWWSKLNEDFTAIEFEGVFTNFRAKVYRVAKNKGVKVKVSNLGELGVAHVRIVAKTEAKSLTVRFNKFLDSLSTGESKSLPDDFSEHDHKYLRVIMSNHKNPFSFREGVITHVDKTKAKSSTDAFTSSFVDFLDSIPFGETKPLPVEFTFANVRKMKMIISHHVNPFIMTSNQVSHGYPAPHINGIGCFIMDGKNWGKREPQWIELKLSRTEYNYKDIK